MPKLTMRGLLIAAMLGAGVIPVLVTTLVFQHQATEALTQRALEQLTASRAGRQGHTEDYIRKRLSQTGGMARNLMVIDAMREFRPAFAAMGDELALSDADYKKQLSKLNNYYTGSFQSEYEKRNGDTIAVGGLIPMQKASVIAQHAYIAENPYPLGQKDKLNETDNGTAYDALHSKYHPVFADYLNRFGFYDIFLIEPEQGTIVYSVFKELDYATSLFNGPYSGTKFSAIVRKAMQLPPGQAAIVDFEPYTPSYNSAASFLAGPIYQDGELLGVLVFQVPVAGLNSIVLKSEGLGETGESILLGPEGLFRSQSRFSDEDSIMKRPFTGNLDELRAQSSDGTGSYVAETGKAYLTSIAPLTLPGLDWTIVSRVEKSEALASVSTLRNTALQITLIAALLVAAFAYFLARRLYARLGADPQQIQQIAQRIGEGDLTDYENVTNAQGAFADIIGMRRKLSETLSQANRIANDVQSGSKDLAEGNLGLSERTEQQAANLEETASSTEELTSTVRQNAENARSANDLAQTTSSRARASGETAGKAVAAMQEISKASEEISEIISVINEIAFQTNLLALNAAVEAARAGEQGRGFAVVASEVRQLAGRSASAAKEIEELIQNSVSKVKGGTELVQESGRELDHIVDSVGRLSQIVSEISSASDEQAVGIDQINQALIHMDSVTQQNAALVEEAAATSKFMSDQANELAEHIGYFSVDSHGNSSIRPEVGISHQPARSEASFANKVKPVARNWQATKSNTPPAPPQEQPAKPQVAAGSGDVWEDF